MNGLGFAAVGQVKIFESEKRQGQQGLDQRQGKVSLTIAWPKSQKTCEEEDEIQGIKKRYHHKYDTNWGRTTLPLKGDRFILSPLTE